jgi:tripartite-type tricarboxylate transporter receptor subunit TctC
MSDPIRRLSRNCLRFVAPLLVVAALQANAALADDNWPNKETLRIVVPYAAGSNGDAVGRVIAQYLGTALKSATIVVENRPGAGGILGTRSVARAAPDGYTLCVCSGGALTIPSLVEKLYDPLVDLTAVSRISTSPLALLVKADASPTSVSDVVAWSHSKQGGLSYGSSGVGGIMYNAGEIFRNKTGADMTHVPFRGGPDAVTALISGQVEVVFAIMSDVMGQVAAKTVRPLAVTTATRSPLLPDVPSMMEQGVKDYDIVLWNGLFAPPQLPKPLLDALSAIMLRMPDNPITRQALINLGSTPVVNTPDQFHNEMQAEVVRWETDLKGVARK